MTDQEILEIYRSVDAYREGHFRLSSGLHSNQYFQSALVLAHASLATKLCEELVRRSVPAHADLVIGPALGAILVAHEIGRALSKPSFFAERVDGRLMLRRGFQIAPDSRVLLAEDVLTTGTSVKELAALVLEAKARIVGVVCLIDRMPHREPLGWPIHSLAQIQVQAWSADSCPLCKSGVPIEKPGGRPVPGGSK